MNMYCFYMFKLSLGVYLKSYKYIWVPIVILAVFMGIGAVILYFGAKDLLTNVGTELKAISGDFNFDANDVISFMVKSVDEIGTGKVDAINYKFLIEKVLEFIKEHNPSYEAYILRGIFLLLFLVIRLKQQKKSWHKNVKLSLPKQYLKIQVNHSVLWVL